MSKYIKEQCGNCQYLSKNLKEEYIAFCTISGEWENIDKGCCFGNCREQYSTLEDLETSKEED